MVDTTIANTIYSDNTLAVYQIDKVLLPLDLFGPPAPIASPKMQKGLAPNSKDKSSDFSPSEDDSSDATGRDGVMSFFVTAVIVAFSL
ncbi:hypothetical protein MKW98_026743 [Papaver atlanticum]|uniref:Fasciclin-like arabinogalactan protein n=1 Tax=Papaver atlanticum TaxID=357466 RepID=A0AAD4X6S9_9MAGN|nr:hypothetical protein MKW98_026743 [Papaver atlanticum]